MASQDGTQDPQDVWRNLAKEFRKMKIPAFLNGDREYELSCATANLLYRFTRPHLVLQPESWMEVLAIVQRAHELKLQGQLTVKCGGHSYTGFSTVDQGIVVDLKRMTEAYIEFKDGKPDVAVVQGGARWGDVYRTLIRKDCRGYVVNGGRCPGVGVGGFILGAGLGPFGRTIGMGSDTMIGATIITLKDGKVVKLKVSEEEEPELFWALRGGGSSAFGIVTEFRLRVCPLKNPDVHNGVTACRYVWIPAETWKDETKEVRDEKLRATMAAFYAADWPDEMTIDSNWMLDIKDGKSKLGIRFTLYYDGPEKDCDDLLEKYIINKTLREALQKRTIPEPSTRFLHETLFLQWEEEARLSLPKSEELSYQLWCSFVFDADAEKMKEVIKAGMEEQDLFEKNFASDKASMWVTYIHSGGQVSKKDVHTSAYPWRAGVFQCSVMVRWSEKWLEKEGRKALESIKARLSQYSLQYKGQCASYVNFADATLTLTDDAEVPHKAYYGQNHIRLQKLKDERDPGHFFNWPWETDTQYGRKPKSSIASASRVTDAEPASKLPVDFIARQAWDTYELPPPSYTELYAPAYMSFGVTQ